MTSQSNREQLPIDLSALLRPLLRYWYLIVLSLIISVLIAQLYLRSVTPVYQMQTTILVRNNEEDGLTKDALQKEILGMGTDPKIYEDARILRSHALIEAVMDSLKLQYRLRKTGKFGEVHLYEDSPIELTKVVAPDRTKSYPLKIHNRSSYSIQINETDRPRGTFGVPLRTDDGAFVLTLKEEAAARLDTAANYVLQVYSLGAIAGSYLGSFRVGYDQKQPTILDLYVRDEKPQRGLDFLEEVVEAYNRVSLENKSRNRKNTLNFIEERIDVLVAELNQIELELERYKTKESLTVDYQTDLPYAQNRIGYYERELMAVETQKRMMEYISEALAGDEYPFFPFVDFGYGHAGLSALVMQYNALVRERSKLRMTGTENHPSIQLTDEKIQSLKINMQEEVTKSLRELEANLKDLQAKNEAYNAELDATPRRERELVDRQRQRVTKENLYKYLLEKREEAAVSIAAVGENAKIIDPPFLLGQVSPKRSSILLGAGLAGFSLPVFAILLFALLDKRLRYKEELINFTHLPVLGNIVTARGKSKLAIRANDHSPSAESFRSLRTNLDFFLPEPRNQILLVTSASVGEGKSFTAVNLGMSYALSDRRVLLIDFDLRNPKVPQYLEVGNPGIGVSDYLKGRAALSDIVQTYEENPYLHYISSGPVPYNPSELLMSDRLPLLLEALRGQYDIIILDSPAIGLVSDGLRLSRFADAGLYVVRVGVTEKEDLKLLQELEEEGKMTHPAIVFNGGRQRRTYQRALKKGYYSPVS